MSRNRIAAKKKASLSDLSRELLSLEEIQIWKEELCSGTDRACALVRTAYLDQLLVLGVSSHFKNQPDTKLINEIFASAQALKRHCRPFQVKWI